MRVPVAQHPLTDTKRSVMISHCGFNLWNAWNFIMYELMYEMSVHIFSPFFKWLCNYWVVRVLYTLIMEKAMATHSSTLAWKIPLTEEPGGLQSMGLLRVGQDWATSLSLFLSRIGEGNGDPLLCSCLENPRGGGAWWAAVYGVAQSRTRQKRLSSNSSNTLMKAVFY